MEDNSFEIPNNIYEALLEIHNYCIWHDGKCDNCCGLKGRLTCILKENLIYPDNWELHEDAENNKYYITY